MRSEPAAASAHSCYDRPLLDPASGLCGIRVFVAEDEPMLLLALEDVLADFGCTLAGSATRVSEAMAFVMDQTFDAAVLDASLTDGKIDPVVDLLAKRGIPFIVASGMSTSELVNRFGNAVTLLKPYKDADLRRALLRVLAEATGPGIDAGAQPCAQK